MKHLLISASLVAAFAAPAAHAAVVSIDDSSPAETLQLYVNAPTTSTSPGSLPPGSGNQVDITTPTNSNGISDIHYNPSTERLSFTFANQINWGSDFFAYRYFTEAGGGISDLYVIQGLAGTRPDYITFSSADNLTGVFLTDAAAIGLQTTVNATPTNLGTVAETGAYQLGFDTGVDQYYVRSDVPEPASLVLLGTALAGLGLIRRRRRSV